MEFENFSMLLPICKNTRRQIMSTKLNANLKAVELTQAELDSVTGGLSAAEAHRIHQVQDLNDAVIQVLKSLGKDVKNMVS
jgi:hypothetical protein